MATVFFSGIQTDCLWQTICIPDRRLLASITQNQHSSDSKSWSRNTDESCHLKSATFSRQCISAQVTGCSEALRGWICSTEVLNHPTYSADLAPSDYFLIRNLKYHLCGWFIDDESLKITVEAWSESKQKILFSRYKLRRKVEKMHWRCRKMSKNDSMCDTIGLC